ncbi:nitroreductase family deazaflavin-dependent oxidoreductase [Nocardia sp. NPDC050793]|uniref:nitroreductase family deazaflavin-dependent oxidoreductase n=1 Tax=Nocardia sp. NPDC050793 TaxID=3155159 RepID=UPI0033C923ED
MKPLPEIDSSLAATDPTSMASFNELVVAEYRANAGQLSGQFADLPVLLLTTLGARSGLSRTTPLCYIEESGTYVIAASKAGADRNPDWYHNLVADQGVTVEVGATTFDAVATIVEGDERDRLYERLARALPLYATYQHKTERTIPVVVLRPRP